ncbi:LegC family aminotransferase [Clostridium botulinum]|uniref:LegC family aminotransferase n=1 Tax=Clostridium botulinum TaxID=1491 RepID=UPI0013FEAFFE|nr:LegC family aminotransferase [Clostridium botulinum]MBY6837878.1 LegC family aminotransferase [Clostridium botulinum]NFG65459.1 LegC family aminotransferase [Clostridium botulinum]NFQ24696.1 LegC family aminotransferase [Clostridium botulinum]
MKKIIPLSVPNLKGNEKKYVLDAIDEEWVSTGGKYINKFEEEIAKYLNVNGAVACQSGTAGLHLSLILSGVCEGDEVIVPTLTFIAAVNPVKYIGANPIFMDCDDTLTIDVEKLKKFCQEECKLVNGNLMNNKSKRHIKAIVVVHVFGNIANMEKLINIAKQYNLKVVEDATEALGSKFKSGLYNGKYAGTVGDFGVYSFNGNKIITTGGGGMIVAKDDNLLSKAKYLSTQAKDDALYYIHNEIGYNYRMTNLQGALGIGQLEQLDKFISIKKENYEFYKSNIEKIKGLSLLKFSDDIEPNYWFYSLVIGDEYPLKRDDLIKYLLSKAIQSRPIWGLIQDQKPYTKCETYDVKKAKYYIDRIINIPCSTNLKKDDIDIVIEVLKKCGES